MHLLAVGWLILAFRLLAILFLAGCAVVWLCTRPKPVPAESTGHLNQSAPLKRLVFKYLVWAGIIFIPLLPFDVSFRNQPGPPHFVPVVMGLPKPSTVEKAKRGEVFMGGCIVSGFEPKWILVW